MGREPERGVYKTTDGGKSWRKILFRNDSTGATELVMDPSNPDMFYAGIVAGGTQAVAADQRRHGQRHFKTTDGGEHWTEITRNPGCRAGLIGNIGMTISPAKPSRIWA